jgi:hypothetical protein
VKQHIVPVAIASLLALAGCSGGNAVSGMGPLIPVPTSAPVATSGPAGSTRANIVITIPAKASAAKASRLRRAYISPATQSISVAIDSAPAVPQNLTPSSPGCVVSSPLATLTCTVAIPTLAGSHTFTFSTYDRLGAIGNLLSTNTVTQTIVANVVNALKVTLDGVPAAIQITPVPGSTLVDASPTTGIQFFGSSAPTAILIVAVDADGNYSLGRHTRRRSAPRPRARELRSARHRRTIRTSLAYKRRTSGPHGLPSQRPVLRVRLARSRQR